MIMKKRISVVLAWVLAGMGALSFLLPWVRPVARTQDSSVLDVSKHLAMEEDSFFDSWIGMRSEEWRVIWKRPTVGLSGFQILLLDSEAGINEAEAKEWLASVFGERGALGRLANVLPLVVLLLTAAFLSPRKPMRQAFVVGGALLFAFYIWGRWRLGATDANYTPRVLAEMEICYGLWITLYSMLALAILAGLRFLNPKAKW